MSNERKIKMYSIAIDGPSGSGKSSVAKAVSARLGFLYVDTGAIYRTVGVFAKRNNIDPHDEETLGANLDKVDIKNLLSKVNTKAKKSKIILSFYLLDYL